MNPNFLTPEDLYELTDYKIPSKQAEVLSRHKINYVIRRDGKVRVTWTQVNNPGGQQPANDDSGFNPDFMQHG
jgi:ribosomal protein L36